MLLETLRADGILSFAPGAPEITLGPLNVIIGPNGSGKSNLIEVLELLRGAPTGLGSVIRVGGGAGEWVWKGQPAASAATIDVRMRRPGATALRYKLSFIAEDRRLEVVDEVVEDAAPDGHAYYRFQHGRPVARRQNGTEEQLLPLDLDFRDPMLSQLRDPREYSAFTWCASQLARIQTIREWSFGRLSALRRPQPADLPTNALSPDGQNLGLLINQLDHSSAGPKLNAVLRRFAPRFERVSTLVQAGTVQVFLHEEGLSSPIPATRLSDGTLRMLAMATVLLAPDPPPLICLEEPELGLHPDAMSLVAELLVDASQRTQLIVTTHSDALVSSLSEHVDSVLVCEHIGGTVLRHLSSERLEHWLEQYLLGDLWRMGHLGGNP